jgi:hypothetical protein
VTWTTHTSDEDFIFTGSIIVIGNRAIDDVPELRAVKTRIASLHLELTPQELQALMRDVARKGYQHGGIRLEPAACLEVCEFLIEQSLSLCRSLDMRLLLTSFNVRLQWEEGDAACHWKDLVAARLRERATASQNRVEIGSREARKQREHEIVAEILAASPHREERVRMWKDRTGKSQAAWYRRLAELDSE